MTEINDIGAGLKLADELGQHLDGHKNKTVIFALACVVAELDVNGHTKLFEEMREKIRLVKLQTERKDAENEH